MSTKDFGCFYCSGKATIPTGLCPDCAEPIDISERLKGLKIAEYEVLDILGRGFNGWTVLAEDHYQRFAIKILPKRRSKDGVFKEPKALADCSPHPNIARFVRFIDLDLSLDGKIVPVSCLVFEHVPDARPLAKIIEDASVKLCKGDVVAILRGIAKGLERMHSRNLWHDDLHDDNILVRAVQSDEDHPGRYEAKLIDFGSATPRDESSQEKGQRSDYAYLSKHIYGLVRRFEFGNQAELTPTDRTFAARLRRLAHRLADSDVSRRSLSPQDISKEVSSAYDECSIGHNYSSFEDMKKHLRVALTEPLENTNALYLAPQDIALLFRDELGWAQRLHRSEPVMVVGPRGCGKTMLLRYLSIGSCARPTKLSETPEDVRSRLERMRHIGFLINVGQLRTPFLRSAYKELERCHADIAEEFCREYLNLSFAYEVVRSLLWLDTERILPLTTDDKELLVALLGNLFPNQGDIHHESLHSFAETIDRRVMLLSNFRTEADYEPTQFARDDVLHRFGQTLRRMTWAQNKEVWLLLDDYSVTVIPELAQKAYNPVIFFPSTELRIKVSSEGEGPNVTDTLKRKYREGREVSKVNLGEVYFQSGEDAGRQFFESILDARFRETAKGSVGDLKSLLGEHSSAGSSFGTYINSLARPGDARFYGFGVICQLCSGDVSFIIELLHSLTQGRWDSEAKQISAAEQDTVVKRFAQRQLSELRNVADYGMRLHNFANCMGDMIKGYLINSKGKSQADERLRIEIEGAGDMGPEAQRMHEALLRYSVLISGGAGKSKTGMPTKKLYFRRMFAPCYPFSPSRSGCIAISIQEYETWLLDPAAMNSKKGRNIGNRGLFDRPPS